MRNIEIEGQTYAADRIAFVCVEESVASPFVNAASPEPFTVLLYTSAGNRFEHRFWGEGGGLHPKFDEACADLVRVLEAAGLVRVAYDFTDVKMVRVGFVNPRCVEVVHPNWEHGNCFVGFPVGAGIHVVLTDGLPARLLGEPGVAPPPRRPPAVREVPVAFAHLKEIVTVTLGELRGSERSDEDEETAEQLEAAFEDFEMALSWETLRRLGGD